MNRQSIRARRILRAERAAEAARQRYARTRTNVALVRMRDAVLAALRAAKGGAA